MSATSLYVQVCRCLLINEGNSSSWDQLLLLLPQLRTALSCRVCRCLITDPVSSKYCQHYVCRGCLKKKKALNPGCKWCLDWSKLEESDRQVRVVLACYKLLCETIQSSGYYDNNVKDVNIKNLVKEAISNSDVLPESNVNVTSTETKIVQGKSSSAGRRSRDHEKTCTRENVARNVAKGSFDGNPTMFRRGFKNPRLRKRNQAKEVKSVSSDSNKKHSPKVGLKIVQGNGMALWNHQSDASKPLHVEGQLVNGKHGQDQNISHTVKSVVPEPAVLMCEVNNNKSGDSLKDVTKVDNMASQLKNRNRTFLQRCEVSRYKRKRKFHQMIEADIENNTCNNQNICRSASQCWSHRPRKQHEVDLHVNKRKCVVNIA